MAPARPVAQKQRKYFSVEEANRALPLVRAIIEDIVQQSRKVESLQERLERVLRVTAPKARRPLLRRAGPDPERAGNRGGEAPELLR